MASSTPLACPWLSALMHVACNTRVVKAGDESMLRAESQHLPLAHHPNLVTPRALPSLTLAANQRLVRRCMPYMELQHLLLASQPPLVSPSPSAFTSAAHNTRVVKGGDQSMPRNVSQHSFLVFDPPPLAALTPPSLSASRNSAYNTRVVKGGDESMPRLDPTKFWDTYCRTKAQADALILAADRTPVAVTDRGLRAGASREDAEGKGKVEANGVVGPPANGHGKGMRAGARAGAGSGGHDDADAGAPQHKSQQEQKQQEEAAGHQGARQEGEPKGAQEEEQAEEAAPLLRTCALRLCGIYGPGEARHLPRVVDIVSGPRC